MRNSLVGARTHLMIVVATVAVLVIACTPTPEPGGGGTGSTTTTWPGTEPQFAYIAETNQGAIRKLHTGTLEVVDTLWVDGVIGSSIALQGDRIFYSQTPQNGSEPFGMYDLTTRTNTRNYLPGSVYQGEIAATPALPDLVFTFSGSSPMTITMWNVAGPVPFKVTTSAHNTVGSNFQDVEFSADGSRMWVAAGAPYHITEVRTSDLRPTGRQFPTGAYPKAVDSVVVDGAELLAAGRSNGSTGSTGQQAFVFDATDPAIVSPFNLNRPTGGDGGAERAGIALSRDGRRVFAAVEGNTSSQLVTVDRQTGSVTRAPFLPKNDSGSLLRDMGEIGVDPATGRVFATGINGLAVYNPDGTLGLVRPMAAPRDIEFTATLAVPDLPPLTTTTTTTPTTSTTSTTSTSSTTTTTVAAAPPQILEFGASAESGTAPLTVAFSWSIVDPNPGPLTCSLDKNDDGVFEEVIPNCTSDSVRSRTFADQGEWRIRLRVTDGTHVVTSDPVTLHVSPPSSDQYGITLRYDESVTTEQRALFAAAADRWSWAVRTGLADTSLVAAADACGTGEPAINTIVDDLLIDVTVEPIDGAGGVLGEAGPCFVRASGGLPISGVMRFDVADVAGLTAAGQFDDVILHEMGHVLGIGVLWDGLVWSPAGGLPSYLGLVARGAYDAVSGVPRPAIPVEALGGEGTAGAHWRESVFGSELMTGWLNPGTNPLSAVSIGSLADLGYGVDLAVADDFSLVGGAAFRSPLETLLHVETRIVRPVGSVG